MAFSFARRLRRVGLVASLAGLVSAAQAAAPGVGKAAKAAPGAGAESSFAQEPDAFEKALPAVPKIPTPEGAGDPVDARDPEDVLRPEEVPVPPFVETVDGVPAIKVKSARGVIRDVKEGQPLEYGDQFQTGARSIVRLVFEKGAQVLVGHNSAVGVYEAAASPDEEKMPVLDISKGETRILVPPAQEREPAAEPSPGPSGSPKRATIRFTVRTKTATMGVRGTDFVVTADAEKSEVHTLTGTVDMAENHESLKRGNGLVAVGAGQFTDRFAGSPVNKARAFEVGEFMGGFKARHPRMEGIFRQAVQDHRSGKLQEKFRGARMSRTIREANRRGIPIKRVRADGTPEVDRRGRGAGQKADGKGPEGGGPGGKGPRFQGQNGDPAGQGERTGDGLRGRMKNNGPGSVDDDDDRPRAKSPMKRQRSEKLQQMRRKPVHRPGMLRPGGG